jgi:hypothetical protein
VASVHDAIVAAMAEQLERRRHWDEPPALYWLHLERGRPKLRQVGIPDLMWALDRPPAVLGRIAVTMAAGRYRSPWPDLFGMAVRHEGWKVEVDPDAPDAKRVSRHVAAQSREHLLHTRPDRIEARMFYAVDRAGWTYQAEQKRGQLRAERMAVPPASDPTITGAVVDALDLMVATMLGVTLPERVEPPAEWVGEEPTTKERES